MWILYPAYKVIRKIKNKSSSMKINKTVGLKNKEAFYITKFLLVQVSILVKLSHIFFVEILK
jgi:hypothetical protein